MTGSCPGGGEDGYNRVDVLLSHGELEFDGGGRDDFGNDERTSPLVVQFLHGVVRGVVLETQPNFVSNLVLWCCPFKGSLQYPPLCPR